MGKIIGYVSVSNPFEDRKAWSGTIYKIREAIEKAGYQVLWISYKDQFQDSYWEKLRKKIMTIFQCDFLGGVHYLPIVKQFAKSIDSKTLNKCDYIFFPKGGQIGLFIETHKPIIYYSDATVFKMINYYWSNVSALSVLMAKYLEKKASQKAFLNLRSSNWAINSVIHDCKCPSSFCHVILYGANIDESDIVPTTAYTKGTLNMLFSGVDWDRKGGDIAVEIMEILRSKGIDAILHIVGIRKIPQKFENNPYIRYHGYLNKNVEVEYLKYIDIWKNTHVFILPTKAECSAIVYCESAAFGVPCYTYDTGGTSDYVVEGENGHCISLRENAREFATCIYNDIINQNMNKLHLGALEMYRDRLSWNAWAIKFREIMNWHDL